MAAHKSKSCNRSNEEIINDLIRTKPKGPGDVALEWRIHKQATRFSAKHPNGYKYINECVTPNFGYTDEQIFALDIRSQQHAVEYFKRLTLIKHQSTGVYTRSAVMRQANLLWSRIEETVTRMMKAGGRGIYAVSNYGHDLAYFFANDFEEAESLAHVMLIPIFKTEFTKPTVRFIERGDINNLAKRNKEIIDRITDDLSYAQRQISTWRENMEKLQHQLDTLQLVQTQQYAIENVNTFKNV